MRDWKSEVRARLDAAPMRPERAAEIEEELAQHLRDAYETLRADGVDATTAETKLLSELDAGLVQELKRVEPSFEPGVALGGSANGFLPSLLQDLQYGARSLLKAPGFTAVCIISLALGIGANTAIFQLLNAVRLRTLPVDDPQQLAIVAFKRPHSTTGERTGRYSEFSYALWQSVREQQQAFSEIAAWGTDSWNLANGGEIRYANGIWVSGDFFKMLHQPALIGRVLDSADDQPGCATGPVVISYAFWQRAYGGETSVLGRKLTLDGRPFEIVGVMPPEFYGVEVGRVFDMAVPLCTEPIIDAAGPLLPMRQGFWLTIFGRLKPGWTLDKANASFQASSPGIMQDTLPTMYNTEDTAKYLASKLETESGANGYSQLRKDYEGPLVLLLIVSGTVLLIACANLANLMLARATVREKEIAIRLALGASRRRLVQQLFTEGVLLALAGAAVGVLLAGGLSAALVRYLLKSNNHVYLQRPLDWRVFGFTVAIAAVTSIVFALLPSYKSARMAPAQVMNSAGRAGTATRERFGFRRMLGIAQIALSLVLVIAALLFVRTLRNLLETDLGFDRNRVLVADCDFTRLHLKLAESKRFADQLLQRVRSIPGVEAAAESSIVPLSGNGWNNEVLIDGVKGSKVVLMSNISSGYFATLRIPLLSGRDFGEQDAPEAPKVAIVNQAFSRLYFANENPIGKVFKIYVFKGQPQYEYRIVGVVRDTKYNDLRETAEPIAYYPLAQTERSEDTAILIRSTLPLASLRGAVSNTIGQMNGSVVYEYSVMKEDIDRGIRRESLLATLSGAFALLAVLLASVGLYGVIAYMVVQRTNEIGVRMALGARPSAIVAMILREAGKMLVAGAVGGLVLALILMRAASTLLYGLKPYDPLTFAVSLAGFAVITLLASALPATRAARLDPMLALREQ